MKAFVLHDDSGKIRGVAIPSGELQNRKVGIRSNRGHRTLLVEIPDGSVEDTHKYCLRLFRTHRVDVERKALLEKKPRPR